MDDFSKPENLQESMAYLENTQTFSKAPRPVNSTSNSDAYESASSSLRSDDAGKSETEKKKRTNLESFEIFSGADENTTFFEGNALTFHELSVSSPPHESLRKL